MFICKNCGQIYGQSANFCSICGGQVVEQLTPVTENPVNYYAPVTPATPVIPVGARVKGIIGMVLGIEGFITALIFAVYGLCFAAITAFGGSYDAEAGMLGTLYSVLWIVYTCIPLAMGIAGYILSKSAKTGGYISKITSSGKIFNMLTIILCGISIFIMILAIVIAVLYSI